MAELPNLTPVQVAALVPQAQNIEIVGRGGQKLVFRGAIDGVIYALKFAKVILPGFDDVEDVSASDIALRAKREVDIMRDCSSPHVVKLGPMGLTFLTTDNGEQIVFFTEEYIEGNDLKVVLQKNGPLPAKEVAKLGRQIGEAIKSLWELGKVHRDIKPANIMRRDLDWSYVLLDAGLAFDADGESISVGPVGTPLFFSPEQFDFNNRRTVLDFRSDMFSLGTTMYCMATGIHPFWASGDNSQSIYTKITTHIPPDPSSIVSGIPAELGEVIMRLLGKSPHLRYRKCDQLIAALQGL